MPSARDTYWLSCIGKQAGFKLGLHSRWRGLAFENDIAARNVGLDAREASVIAHGVQVGHRKVASSPDIHSAK